MVMINCSVELLPSMVKEFDSDRFYVHSSLISLTGGVRSHGGQETVIIGESGTERSHLSL